MFSVIKALRFHVKLPCSFNSISTIQYPYRCIQSVSTASPVTKPYKIFSSPVQNNEVNPTSVSLQSNQGLSRRSKEDIYNTLLNIKQKNQSGVRIEPKHVDRLINEMLSYNNSVLDSEYSLMLDITAKAHMGNAAYKVLQHYSKQNRQISQRDFTNTLLALSSYSLHASYAESVLKLIKDNGKMPNRMNYECVISVFIKEGNVEKAESLFKEMKLNNIKPNTWTYNILLNGCLKTNNCNHGLELFNEMQTNNIKPDTISCNTMIKLMGQCEKFNMMEVLLKQMIQFNIPVDIITYNTLIGMYCRKGDIKKAFDIFYSIPTTLTPDIKTFNTLISGCSISKDLESATNIFNQIISRGIVPNIVTYSNLCTCGLYSKQYSFGLDLFLNAITEGTMKNFAMGNGYFNLTEYPVPLLLECLKFIFENIVTSVISSGNHHSQLSISIKVGEGKVNREKSIAKYTEVFLKSLSPPITNYRYTKGILCISRYTFNQWLETQMKLFNNKSVNLNVDLLSIYSSLDKQH